MIYGYDLHRLSYVALLHRERMTRIKWVVFSKDSAIDSDCDKRGSIAEEPDSVLCLFND